MLKGKYERTLEHRNKMTLIFKGKPVTHKIDCQCCVCKAKNGKLIISVAQKEQQRQLRLGKTLKEMGHKKDCKCAFCNAYIDGRTPLNTTIKNLNEYKDWRIAVFSRDNYTCQDCGNNSGGNLEAHHAKPFAQILSEFLKEYDQFSPVEDKEVLVKLAIKYKPFWEVFNGETLCETCHQEVERIKNVKTNQKETG